MQIRLARGRAENEMTQFRYHVLLHLGDEAHSNHAIDWQDWTAAIDPAAVAEQLRQTQSKALGIKNIPNRRIAAALQVADWLTQTAPKTVGQMRDCLAPTGIDPKTGGIWKRNCRIALKFAGRKLDRATMTYCSFGKMWRSTGRNRSIAQKSSQTNRFRLNLPDSLFRSCDRSCSKPCPTT
ncbi:MAG: hypothetical protein HC895_27205 [Leptolyngbyaceae cyanobacterium SM1_3_5]|nr:hypothetical protein [Leptolyngbyaceae cyanobacterium SM1_3_5]